MTKTLKNISSILFLLLIFSYLKGQTPDAILLINKTDMFMSGNKMECNYEFAIQINNRNGDKFADISIPYSKIFRISKIEAAIIDENGNVIKKLKSSDIKDRSAISDISLYEDDMLKEFSLRHHVYPYTLRYSFTGTKTEFLDIIYWQPVLDRRIPTLSAQLTVRVPRDYMLSYFGRNTSGVKKDSLNGQKIYNWNATYVPAPPAELYSPDIDLQYPMVRVVPENFIFKDKGSFKSWKTYGNWQFDINARLLQLPDNEKEKIRLIVSGITDQRERMKVLYHYLQDNTRYINVSVETGGMVPYPASYVAENKYGDCKALTNYLRAILDFVGIKSFYTTVQAGDNIVKLYREFPSQQSNHVILMVPLDNDTVWLDCTSKGPFNYLGTFTQNRDALVIDKDNTHFVRTPALTPDQTNETRTVVIRQLADNGATADFENTCHGEMFELLHNINTDYGKENQNTIIRNYFIEDGFDLMDYQLIPQDRDSAFIQLKYRTKNDKIFAQYGSETLLKTLTFTLPKFEKPSVRKYPLEIEYPVSKTDTQTYILSDKYKTINKPQPFRLESEFGAYEVNVETDNNRIRIVKKFRLNAGEYGLNKYVDFYDFITQVSDNEKKLIFLLQKEQ
jgi:hypothetical protein